MKKCTIASLGLVLFIIITLGLFSIINSLTINSLIVTSDSYSEDFIGNSEDCFASQLTATNVDSVSNETWLAQTFNLTERINCTIISLYIEGPNNDWGTCALSIRTTNASGAPTGSDLAVSNKSAEPIPTNLHWENFTLNTILNASTKYAMVFRFLGGPNAMGWGCNLTDAYPNGTKWYSFNSGETWFSQNIDYCFKIYGYNPTYIATLSQTPITINLVTVNNETWIDYNATGNQVQINNLYENSMIEIDYAVSGTLEALILLVPFFYILSVVTVSVLWVRELPKICGGKTT